MCRFEAGEEATDGRVAERPPPPANDAAPDFNGNKIEAEPNMDVAAPKPEPMDATDVPQNVAVEARKPDVSALPGPMDTHGVALPLAGVVAPVQFGAAPVAVATGAAGAIATFPAGVEMQATQGVSTAPAGASQPLPAASGMPAAMAGVPGPIRGGVAVVSPGTVAAPAVMVQGQPGAPVTQAQDPNRPPFAASEAPALPPQSAAAQPPPAPAPGQASGGGAVQ